MPKQFRSALNRQAIWSPSKCPAVLLGSICFFQTCQASDFVVLNDHAQGALEGYLAFRHSSLGTLLIIDYVIFSRHFASCAIGIKSMMMLSRNPIIIIWQLPLFFFFPTVEVSFSFAWICHWNLQVKDAFRTCFQQFSSHLIKFSSEKCDVRSLGDRIESPTNNQFIMRWDIEGTFKDKHFSVHCSIRLAKAFDNVTDMHVDVTPQGQSLAVKPIHTTCITSRPNTNFNERRWINPMATIPDDCVPERNWPDVYSDLFAYRNLQPCTTSISEINFQFELMIPLHWRHWFYHWKLIKQVYDWSALLLPKMVSRGRDVFLDCVDILQPVTTLFFQRLDNMTTFPTTWHSGIFRRVSKKRCDAANPDFHQWTIMTTFCYKIFVHILTRRLKQLDSDCSCDLNLGLNLDCIFALRSPLRSADRRKHHHTHNRHFLCICGWIFANLAIRSTFNDCGKSLDCFKMLKEYIDMWKTYYGGAIASIQVSKIAHGKGYLYGERFMEGCSACPFRSLHWRLLMMHVYPWPLEIILDGC